MQKYGDYWNSIVPGLMWLFINIYEIIENKLSELGKFWNKH